MSETNGGKEIYLTVEEVAAYLKLAAQTIRKYVLLKTIPYRKINKVVRFRLSEIEKWIDQGGGCPPANSEGWEGDLAFPWSDADVETGDTGEVKA